MEHFLSQDCLNQSVTSLPSRKVPTKHQLDVETETSMQLKTILSLSLSLPPLLPLRVLLA